MNWKAHVELWTVMSTAASKDLSRSQATISAVIVVISHKQCKIETLLLRSLTESDRWHGGTTGRV